MPNAAADETSIVRVVSRVFGSSTWMAGFDDSSLRRPTLATYTSPVDALTVSS